MFGSVVMTSGSARSHFRAAWPSVWGRSSVRKPSASIFWRPSSSHDRGRWLRWSLAGKVVSVVYLPSSIPEEWGTRTNRPVSASRAASSRSRPGSCSRMLWIMVSDVIGRRESAATPSSRQPIFGPSETP